MSNVQTICLNGNEVYSSGFVPHINLAFRDDVFTPHISNIVMYMIEHTYMNIRGPLLNSHVVSCLSCSSNLLVEQYVGMYMWV